MIYTATALLLGSTRKLRFSYCLSSDSLKYFDPLLQRNLSTATARLGFVNPNNGNPTTDNPPDLTAYKNGFNGLDQSLVGFQPNSYGQNPYGFYQNGSNQIQSNEIFNQRLRNWQTSDGSSSYVYGNDGYGIPQEAAALVHRQASPTAPTQSWDSYNGGQSQKSDSPDAHFQQDGSCGHSSLDELDSICREGNLKEAVDLIKSWRNEGYVVDLPRLLWLAQLCGDVKALEEAKVVHEFIASSVSFSDIGTYNAVIEMYSCCGSVEDALIAFNSMPEKNLQTWCGIIRCFAKNGQGEGAIDMFSRFKEEGNRPDGEIFKEIFLTCGVLGDIDEGILHFESMSRDYGIIPSIEHYVSLVKMVGEAGYLDEALGFVESMEPNVDLWETLMNLSWIQGDLELGDRCRDMVEQLDASRLNKETKAGLVPIKPSDLAKERLQRIAKRKTFVPDNRFAAGDISRPENREYYVALKCLNEHMVELGYVPQSKIALHDVDQESKDENLFNHTERFAFIRQMLNSSARSQIMVLKNIRVCIDCHTVLRLMSKIAGRKLVSRDAKRFHHMEDGVCSCKEYW